MKRTALILTLILCLALCALAFASCDKKDKATTTAVSGCAHVWGDYVVDLEPTCSEPGIKSKYCTKCGAQDPDSVAAIETIPHTEADAYSTDTPATCSTVGWESKHCTVCGAIIASTARQIDKDPDAHNVENWEVTSAATLLNPIGHRHGVCTLCSQPQDEDLQFKHNVQTFTTSGGRYTAGYATLGEVRGDKHFYDAGNDMLIEYSVLWNETLLNLYKPNPDATNKNSIMPTIDSRFVPNAAGSPGNSGIVRWELASDVPSQWCTCKYAGGFEVAAFETSESDNPYPNFGKKESEGAVETDYPNIGGANLGGGQPLGETQWGWHRVSARFRQEITNMDKILLGDPAEYKLQVWVYIDGMMVLHCSDTDHVWEGGDKTDRKLYSAEPDGNGGIKYTENDNLYIHGAFLDSKKMASGVGYFEIADYSVTIGSNFVQKVRKVTSPVADTLTVAEGVTVPSTMWYELNN